MAESSVDYDSVQTFWVYSQALSIFADNIFYQVGVIADSLDVIAKTLENLNLGWAGKTAQEAKDFGDRWARVANDVFGSKDHPEKGKLNLVASGVDAVASLFASGEQGLTDFFTSITTALANPVSDSGPPKSITDVTMTAVTETW